MAATTTQYSVDQCDAKGRENHTVVVEMDGALLIDRSPFAYYALIAFDVGAISRLLLLLLAAPLAWLLHHLLSESAATRVLIFATFAGVRVRDIKSAANAVLPKHYSEDLHPETWRVFSSCGRKCVVTVNPRIMVEPFLKNYLGVDLVLGTEIESWKGIATGLVAAPGVLASEAKAVAVMKAFGTSSEPEIGICDTETDSSFLNLCKEKYIVPTKRDDVRPVKQDELPKPVIFHDGRLVQKPTPLTALLIILWFPIGVLVSILRVIVASQTLISLSYHVINLLLGTRITVKGNPPPKRPNNNSPTRGVAFVCSHRTVLDNLFVAVVLRRSMVSMTYSVARLTEILSPIRTCRLTRNRDKDAKLISDILGQGQDLVLCPEGTTCREPYLLRFSSLFAELTDEIVPVAVNVKTSMFHGTTARGHKWLDAFFFAMNPRPVYEITFLDKLSPDETCGSGKSSYEVANNVQGMIAKVLNFKCSNLTRRDKYRMLAGTDGLVGQKPGAAKRAKAG